MKKYSVNTICFEGICRIYRNSCTQHIRSTLKRVYPDDYEKHLSGTFKEEEWEKIKSNAELLRKTGEIESEIIDEIDIIGVNHFYNVFERYFDDLFPSATSLPPDVKKDQKQAILGWARHIKRLRDPALGHPAYKDLTRDDALSLLDAAKRILKLFDENASNNISILIDTLVGQDFTIVSTTHVTRKLDVSTLPPRDTISPRFIGREQEIGILKNWIRDPETKLWLLAGDGGKGKTAIAFEFASRISNDPPTGIDLIIWLSAKKRIFTFGHIVQTEANFNNLEAALDRVLEAYGESVSELSDINIKESKVIEYLSLLPALIVLDDVDSLEGEAVDAMNFFMFRLKGTASKILLTSRRVTHFGMEPFSTQVEGFAENSIDGTRFVESRIELFNLDPALFSSKRIVQNIIKTCDGSPLFIEDLLRLCCLGVTPDDALKTWSCQDGEEARKYALEREYSMLTDNAKCVLLACSLYDGAASIADIAVATNMPQKKVLVAVSELQTLFLVPKPRLIENEPRFDLNRNTRKLVLEVEGETDLARSIEKCIAAVTQKLQTTPVQRIKINQYVRQAISLVKLDKHVDAETTLKGGIEAFPESAELHGALGWVYKNWAPPSRFADARVEFIRTSELKGKRVDPYIHWSQMEAEDNEWTRSAEAAEHGLVVLPRNMKLGYLAGSARLRLGKSLASQAQNDRADQELRKAERLLKSLLGEPKSTEIADHEFRGHIYRALVLTYEQLAMNTAIPKKGRTNVVKERFIRLLGESLCMWIKEHPNDTVYYRRESGRLVTKFPSLVNIVKT